MNAAVKDDQPHGPTAADLDPRTGDWSRPYIRYRLDLAGYRLTDVARLVGRQGTAAVDTLRGRKSRPMEQHIAQLLGVTPEEIWPSRYRNQP